MRIAIVGSGVSGLGALYALKSTEHEVHLYEAANRLGGHTHTVPFNHNGKTIPVDTGFIVLNTATYPNFIAFLKELAIETVPTEMTFGICRDRGAFEWSGTSLSAVFAQRSNLRSPRFWRMIFDIVKFNQFALDLLISPPENPDMSIGEYLEENGYSAVFRDDYLIPMTACVWSTGPDKCALDFPAMTLVRFMWNHHLLSTVAARPAWLTINGGSQRYIDAVLKGFPPDNIHLSTAVESLSPGDENEIILDLSNGQQESFDKVIFACHGDQAYDITRSFVPKKENDVLSNFQTTPNKVYLHSDISLMPKRRLAWSSWNYLTSSTPSSAPSRTVNLHPDKHPAGALQTVSLTYNMNILQHIPTSTYGDVLVTMNPPHPPKPSLTQAVFDYRHPLYNAAAVTAQEKLHDVQGESGVYYCGAWTGYGFHEDGFGSGIRVATRRELGGSVPWEVVDAKFARGYRPVLGVEDYAVRGVILWIQFLITLFEYAVQVAGGVLMNGTGKKLL